MKKIYSIAFVLFQIGLIAQTNQDIPVQLTRPGQPGFLKLYNHNGEVDVMGYEGNEVIVSINMASGDKDDDGRDKHKTKHKGLKKISNNATGVTITEDDNYVLIQSSNNNKKRYTIKVPYNFSLNIDTHHDGDISITDVNGMHELNGHHGGIEALNVSGSVMADTHHGSIIVLFNDIERDMPMAFTTYHGDVDITLPSNVKINTKMKTRHGDIYTDFDMETLPEKVKESSSKSHREIQLSGWVNGIIGGGGVEFLMDTYHGDVIIRSL